MTYQEATDFLFSQLASYQSIGSKAFNKSLDKTIQLLKSLGNPQDNFKSIHVAGTNGKGSSCHMLASILQESGYKVGLFTSPHLKSFTERIKVNGQKVSEQFVTDFVTNKKDTINQLKPSFFEITTAMAFQYFSDHHVDIAVIETGLGGRLDSTNVVKPLVSLITTIGYDHKDILGSTLEQIATEKAGIIKYQVPVVIGQQQKPNIIQVFEKVALEKSCDIHIVNNKTAEYTLGLKGNYQRINLPGVLKTIEILTLKGFSISKLNVQNGLMNVIKNTGIKGRWQILNKDPITICDTAHNIDAFKHIVEQLQKWDKKQVFMILGFVDDKDIDAILTILPHHFNYVFIGGANGRLLKPDQVQHTAEKFNINGEVMPNVNEAIKYVESITSKEDVIFIGGSTFVVAEIENL